jgi:hypothetical protein
MGFYNSKFLFTMSPCRDTESWLIRSKLLSINLQLISLSSSPNFMFCNLPFCVINSLRIESRVSVRRLNPTKPWEGTCGFWVASNPNRFNWHGLAGFETQFRLTVS